MKKINPKKMLTLDKVTISMFAQKNSNISKADKASTLRASNSCYPVTFTL